MSEHPPRPDLECRLCGTRAVVWASHRGVSLSRCPKCRFVSGHPLVDRPVAERYDHCYRGESPPAPEYRYHQWLRDAERIIGVGRLLEVGAGSGGFVGVAMRRGWAVDATEVAPAGVERLRGLGASVFRGDVCDARFSDSQFDLVVALEVLEHLPRPGDHLVELARVTRLGGVLLLTTPNFGGLSRRCLGLDWRAVDPEHLGYFTAATLKRAVMGAGFRSVRVRSRTLDISTWPRHRGAREAVRFDPEASATLRDAVEGRRVLRAARESVNVLLWLTGLGDSLWLWARR